MKNDLAPGDLAVGDYVFASRWSDCDWNAPWAVGYVLMLTNDRVIVGNEDGTMHPQIGTIHWKYAMRITLDQGNRILDFYPGAEGTQFDPAVAASLFDKELPEGVNDRMYKLITLYSTYEIPAGDKWLVYGHIDISANESLGRYDTMIDALTEAFKYGVPVMIGRSYDEVLMKLVS